jgi:hypothetical protein
MDYLDHVVIIKKTAVEGMKELIDILEKDVNEDF